MLLPRAELALSQIRFLAEAILLMRCDIEEIQAAIGLIAELADQQLEHHQLQLSEVVH